MRRRSFVTLLATSALVTATVGPATAAVSAVYHARLSGANEVPAIMTSAAGRAIFWLNSDHTELRYQVVVHTLDNALASHIHLAPAGENGAVVAFLFGPAAPGGRFNGVLATGTITAQDLIGPLAGTSLADLIAAIEAGNAYVNVHTIANTGGEIRGQIG